MIRFPPVSRASTNGLELAFYEAGAGPAVVLLHGFPELAYSWRHQIEALAARGWRAIAPDQRGYGATGLQGELSHYSMRHLALDIVGLLDALELERAVIIGHDFGGSVAWTLARDHSERVAGIVSLNTPYTRRGEKDLVRLMIEHRGPSNYMVQFQEPGVGEALLERDIGATLRAVMRRPALPLAEFRQHHQHLQSLPVTLFTGEPAVMGEPVMSEEDLEVFIAAFEKTGFTGGLNWYRNLTTNWLDTAGCEDLVRVPALMVSAADDYFLPPETTRSMERHVPDLERHLIPNCGHWTQHEATEEVNQTILEWLERKMRPRFT
jgi:soluble epoxide hydrolase / lipid-phosphate phosphatase